MTAPELKPCPFCGGSNVGWKLRETYSIDSSYAFFGCRDCDMGTDMADMGTTLHPDDVAAWNRRADLSAVQPAQPDPHDEVIARLVEALEMMRSTYPYNPPCFGWQEQIEAHKAAKVALAAAKAVQHG